MPSANAGNEMPETASVMPMRSGQRLRYTADTMPMPMPNITAHTMLVTVSKKRRHEQRSAISVDTGRLVRSDRPKSPCSMLPKKRTNCCGSGWSSPRSWRTSATVSGPASGPAASRAGSPGSRCTNRNTSTADDQQRRQQAEQALEDVVEHRCRRSVAHATGTQPPTAFKVSQARSAAGPALPDRWHCPRWGVGEATRSARRLGASFTSVRLRRS